MQDLTKFYSLAGNFLVGINIEIPNNKPNVIMRPPFSSFFSSFLKYGKQIIFPNHFVYYGSFQVARIQLEDKLETHLDSLDNSRLAQTL
jgi:hypothetical protein